MKETEHLEIEWKGGIGSWISNGKSCQVMFGQSSWRRWEMTMNETLYSRHIEKTWDEAEMLGYHAFSLE